MGDNEGWLKRKINVENYMSIPTITAVIKQAIVPPIKALNPSFESRPCRDGTRDPIPPI